MTPAPVTATVTAKPDARGDTLARASERVHESPNSPARPALDALIEDVGQVRADVRPAFNEFTGSVEAMARDSARRVGEQAIGLQEASAAFVRTRPLQSLMLAAGLGASLMLLLRLLARASASER